MSDKNLDYQERIEKYLDGKMNKREIDSFKADLQSDENLAKAYAFEETARLIVETAGRNELRNRLETYESAFEKKSSTPKTASRTIQPWLAFAAAITILGVISFWLLSRITTSDKSLFANHFEVFRTPSALRGDTVSETWELATQAFAKKDYIKAEQLFESSLQDSATITYLGHFYLGISLLAQQPPQAKRALSSFETVLLFDHDYREQTMWYMALSLIELNQTNKAKSILEELKKTGTYKEVEVEELLKEL